jgi:hypothetical protein
VFAYRIRIIVATYCFVPPHRNAKFCGVVSGVIIKDGCAMGKKKVAEHWFSIVMSVTAYKL